MSDGCLGGGQAAWGHKGGIKQRCEDGINPGVRGRGKQKGK